jgi:hypothetical protein
MRTASAASAASARAERRRGPDTSPDSARDGGCLPAVDRWRRRPAPARPVMGTRRRARSRPCRRGGESPGPRASVRSRSARAPRRRGGGRGCLTSRRTWRRTRVAHTSVGARRAPTRATTPPRLRLAALAVARGPTLAVGARGRRAARLTGPAVPPLGRTRLLAGRVVQVRLDRRGRLVEQSRDLGDRPALVAVVLRLQHLPAAPHAAVLGIAYRRGSLTRHNAFASSSTGWCGRPPARSVQQLLAGAAIGCLSVARAGRARPFRPPGYIRRSPTRCRDRMAPRSGNDRLNKKRLEPPAIGLQVRPKSRAPTRSLLSKAGAARALAVTTASRPRRACGDTGRDARFRTGAGASDRRVVLRERQLKGRPECCKQAWLSGKPEALEKSPTTPRARPSTGGDLALLRAPSRVTPRVVGAVHNERAPRRIFPTGSPRSDSRGGRSDCRRCRPNWGRVGVGAPGRRRSVADG